MTYKTEVQDTKESTLHHKTPMKVQEEQEGQRKNSQYQTLLKGTNKIKNKRLKVRLIHGQDQGST